MQTALANAKVQLVTARNNYAVAEAQLSQAMGVSVSEQYALADEQVPPIAGEDGDRRAARRARARRTARRSPTSPTSGARRS